MSNLEVMDTNVAGVLDKLRKGEWLIPRFQRDFVWTTDQVAGLVHSIVEARPIGMVTFWEQSESSTLELESISIPDRDPGTQKPVVRYFSDPETFPKKRYAVLDGRQRCTAIAMAFAGFRAAHGLYRFSGRYFLDVTELDPRNRVRFFREADVKKRKLNVDSHCVAQGLFPLASNQDETEELFPQWARYLQALHNPENYEDGKLPPKDEMSRRNAILQQAFQGITETKLAIYTVSEGYSLSDICDIFENLNTTGTKVSTVDLIHSWLYADTINDLPGPFLLRDWITDLGQKDGAIGWASISDRPELTAQIVTACYVALEKKPPPRPSGKGKMQPLASVKSGDLLATPADHWKAVHVNEDLLANYIGDAQLAVAGGYFPWQSCPYPVSLAIYVGLRWHGKFDAEPTRPWGRDELDALFKAFFWRNALARRYDQGFLTQLGADLVALKTWLSQRPKFPSSSQWAKAAEEWLDKHITEPLPSKADLVDMLTNGNQGGAIQKALLLPMQAGAKKDLVDTGTSIAFPNSNEVEVHHIYPKEWCRNNKVGPLATLLDEQKAGRDWVNSVANLMPLSRTSNNNWKQKVPAMFIAERGLEFAMVEAVLGPLFIDEEAFKQLSSGDLGVETFWKRRAELIAEDLKKRERVIL